MAPDIATALLYMEPLYQPWQYARLLGASGLHPYYRTLSPSFVQKAHANQIAVRPFTINRERLMKQMFEHRVDAIFTDYPLKAKQVKK